MDYNKLRVLITIIGLVLVFGCKENDPKPKLELPSIEGKKVLMVYGGWDGHQPDVFTERVSKWLTEDGAIVTISDSLGVYTNKKLMESMDLIIQYWTMGQITKEQFQGLEAAVKNGTGLAGCHGGLGDSFRNNPEYQYMIGGQWVEHPGGIIKSYGVHIVDSNDPVSRGIEDFKIKNTEQYYMHIDPNTKVLATTKFTDSIHPWIKDRVIPVSWKTYYGDGRVFYLSIGHNPNDFNTPQARELLLRGIKWASASKHLPKEETLQAKYE